MIELSAWTVNFHLTQGECEMNISLPKTISGWCMWLFFLCVGLTPFVAVLASVTPWLALAYAVFALIGM
jgi:hypothetical protein